jgi:hypothetical protein
VARTTTSARTVPREVRAEPRSKLSTRLFDHLGEPPRQFRRLDRGAVRRVRPAQHVRRVEPLARGGRVEQVEIQAVLGVLMSLGPRPVELRLRTGEHDGAADCDVRIDVLGGRDPGHLVHRVLHRAVLGNRGAPAGLGGQGADADRIQRGAPAAVTPGRTEAGDLGLEHGDPQLGSDRLQVVRRPQSGEPGADDRHVDGGVSGQGRARRQFAELVEPEVVRQARNPGRRRRSRAPPRPVRW